MNIRLDVSKVENIISAEKSVERLIVKIGNILLHPYWEKRDLFKVRNVYGLLLFFRKALMMRFLFKIP